MWGSSIDGQWGDGVVPNRGWSRFPVPASCWQLQGVVRDGVVVPVFFSVVVI